MMLRAIDGGDRVHRALKMAAVAAVALVALLLSTAALAQRMHGAGGAQWSGHGGGFHQFNAAGHFPGGHPGGGFRGHHHRGHFGGAVVIGAGLGFWYPAAYPYPYYAYPLYDPAVAVPSGQAWYCDALGAYYPYVATCPGPWRPVVAPPPQ